MRIGQNPAKSMDSVAQPERVTVAVITYIPMVGGYYAESLDILKVCLGSIWANTQLPYELMVFDNGSCEPVRKYLAQQQQKGRIQYLVLSEKNIGKAGAWNFIFGAAPGEFIAYADSDVYHFPGWLKAQIKVLEQFPESGMVTGMPMWTPDEFSTSTVEWAEDNPDVRLARGRLLSWEDYWRHARSLGAEELKAREHFETHDSVCMYYQESRFYVGAAHFQFIARKDILQKTLPIPSERPMGQVRLLDIALNQLGYLRLCTSQWWVQHLGNTLEADFRKYLHQPSIKRKKVTGTRFWNAKWVNKIVRWLYHKSFEKLYKQ